jgi:hypothetical protein
MNGQAKRVNEQKFESLILMSLKLTDKNVKISTKHQNEAICLKEGFSTPIFFICGCKLCPK